MIYSDKKTLETLEHNRGKHYLKDMGKFWICQIINFFMKFVHPFIPRFVHKCPEKKDISFILDRTCCKGIEFLPQTLMF